jgi:class 3 adenylate cyclase
MEQTVDAYKIGDRRAAAFDAMVQFARGQILLAEKDWAGAVTALKQARDEWQGIGAPYETARARAALGAAYRRGGDEHASTVELEAALATFERLGAGPEAARLKELLGRTETRRTFLFTDIVDSTKLLETLGDDKWKRLLARHDEVVGDAITASGGEVVKRTGDGFFASFETPTAAIEAAVAIQRALASEIVAPDIRIGAHAGGAFRTDSETADYGGQGVHVAARIGAAAGTGEILVSAETLDASGGGFRAAERRTASLKGVAAPIEVVAIEWR